MQDNIDYLKRNVFIILNTQEIPEDIIKIIKEIYLKLENLLTKRGIKDANLSGYLFGNNAMLQKELESIFKVNNEDKREQVIQILDGLELFREDKKINRSSEEKDKENLSESVNNQGLNAKIAQRMIESTNDSITNAQNTIMRYLSNNNFSQEFLDRLSADIHMLKNIDVNSKEDMIKQDLDEQDKKTLTHIVEVYNTIVQDVKGEHRKFIESYSSPIDERVEKEIIEKHKAGEIEEDKDGIENLMDPVIE